MKVRKKPVEVEAFKFTLKKKDREPDWFLKEIGNSVIIEQVGAKQEWFIMTLEGKMKISKGDWVIKGVHNEIYPCKPDIFNLTYDVVEDKQ